MRCEHALSEIVYRFTIRSPVEDEGGGYLIEIPDLPGSISDGGTMGEAIANAEDAKRWIATMKQAGRPIPPASVEPTESCSRKGQFRAPKSRHRRLAERTSRESADLNTLAVLLAEGLGESVTHGD
jgi:antitoxin HicB